MPGQDATRVAGQVALANHLARAIAAVAPRAADPEDLVAASHDVLTAIVPRRRPTAKVDISGAAGNPAGVRRTARQRARPACVSALRSARRWPRPTRCTCSAPSSSGTGVRLLQDAVRELTARGGRLRVITTTYMGATEQRALDKLAELGAEIRISYETRTTRLHAKAWLFRRQRGQTAYVGSSNLSKAALVDGLEWNVRLSELEQDARGRDHSRDFRWSTGTTPRSRRTTRDPGPERLQAAHRGRRTPAGRPTHRHHQP